MSSKKSVHGARKKRKLEPEPTTIEQSGSYPPVLESHLNLLKQGTFTDVTFIVGESKERIPCHQLFLKARSSVFGVMLSERWNQDTDKEITLEDVEPKAFKMFLQFIYADTFVANVPEALELLQVAHMYDVQLLVSKCEALLESEVTLENVLGVYQAARKYGINQLMDKAGDLLAKSLPKVQALPCFSQLNKETLIELLKREDLKMREVDLFRLALQWAGNQTDATVEESLKEILPLVRFPTMTLNEFTTTVVPTNLVSPSKLFTHFAAGDKLKKSLARTLEFSIMDRQPNDSIVSVALYPEDILNKRRTNQKLQKLKECLQFFYDGKLAQYRGFGSEAPYTSTDLTRKKQPIQGIGLRGFSFYCPAKSNMPAPRGTASVLFKEFKILLKSKDSPDKHVDFYDNLGYKKLIKLPCVQVEEGKITEIKFDTEIPLMKKTIYCIVVQEITRTQAHTRLQNYNTIDFGPRPNKFVDVNIGNKYHTTLAVRRNKLFGFWTAGNPHARPKLICNLTFEEL